MVCRQIANYIIISFWWATVGKARVVDIIMANLLGNVLCASQGYAVYGVVVN